MTRQCRRNRKWHLAALYILPSHIFSPFMARSPFLFAFWIKRKEKNACHQKTHLCFRRNGTLPLLYFRSFFFGSIRQTMFASYSFFPFHPDSFFHDLFRLAAADNGTFWKANHRPALFVCYAPTLFIQSSPLFSHSSSFPAIFFKLPFSLKINSTI